MWTISKKLGFQLLAWAVYASVFHTAVFHTASAEVILTGEPTVSSPASSIGSELSLSLPVQTSHEPALAEQDKFCSVTKSQHSPSEIVVWQHRFEDGSFDLAIAKWRRGEIVKISRLSFKGSKQPACHFTAVALMKGGDWGWHIAWSSSSSTKPGVYYARLDGDAWVSSLPKQMSGQPADLLELNEQADILILKYAASHMSDANVAIARSNDEGRNWEMSPP